MLFGYKVNNVVTEVRLGHIEISEKASQAVDSTFIDVCFYRLQTDFL